jgi:hypothetical protein
MSNNYTPDCWVIVEVKFNDTGESERKILSSWYGGYLGSDSWRLSSGIVKIIEHKNYYEIHNSSGSVYNCNKACIGMSGYTMGIYENFKRQLAEKNMGSMEVVGL